jgi:UDP-N-acetylglucosamine--N-acetylmuramyl-(pentapeptide) pyrophosphoryl-undecaprenol N-acetylglucosamine transferase
VKPVRILNYAVNGLGLGHISRLISINRWIRRITGALGINTEIYFLTSSECDSIAYQNGFAAFKIPSKNIIKETGIPQVRYRKIAKQWIWNAVNLCSPDILIVDTFPYGSFHELFDVMDLGFKKIFIYRAIKSEIAGKNIFQKSLFGYDKIIIPLENPIEEYIMPDTLKERVSTSGEVIIRDLDELHPRKKARDLLGLNEDDLVCYVTAGGGGDPNIENTLFLLTKTLTGITDIKFVIGAGPLYRGKEFHSPNTIWTTRSNIIEYYNAFDFAVSAGGYNSSYELLYAGLPTIFFNQDRLYDDQEKRINNLAEKESCLKLKSNDPDEIIAAINTFRDINNRQKYSVNAKSVIPRNNAIEIAKMILEDIVTEESYDHVKEFIPGSFFYSLKESGILETIGLKALYIFDSNYHNLQKQKNAVKYVSDFLDLTPEMEKELHKTTENLFTDFIDYPINNIALGYLQYLQNKNINLETGIKFIGVYIENHRSVNKSIQDLMLDSIKQIEYFCALKGNIEDQLTNYILFEKNGAHDIG